MELDKDLIITTDLDFKLYKFEKSINFCYQKFCYQKCKLFIKNNNEYNEIEKENILKLLHA